MCHLALWADFAVCFPMLKSSPPQKSAKSMNAAASLACAIWCKKFLIVTRAYLGQSMSEICYILITSNSAGVATAFAAPIGGLLFTVEEGVSFYSTSIFWRGFLSTGIGVFTLHFLVECAVSCFPG